MYYKKTKLQWPFMGTAACILIFGYEIVWWQAILVIFLASFYVEWTVEKR